MAPAGTADVVWVAPSRPGTYFVQALAATAGRARRSEPVGITVGATRATAEGEGARPPGPLAVAAAALLAAVALFWVLLVGRIE